MILAAAVLVILQIPRASSAEEVRTDYRSPARSYLAAAHEQRVIWVERQLHEEDPKLEQRALARLRSNLDLFMARLPEPARASLSKQPIYLMYGAKAKGGGKSSGARYFRSKELDRGSWLDSRWRDSLVIYSAENYVWLSDLWAAKLLAHELAHAYHFSHYPERQPDIVAAYGNAVAQGLYRQVQTTGGKTMDKAYALERAPEYFAELSAMYFVGGNYFPYDRAGLKSYDPEGYAVVEKLWGVPPEPREAP